MWNKSSRRAAPAVCVEKPARPARAGIAPAGLLPLGAMAAGIGLLPLQAFAQAAAPSAPAAAASAAGAASAPPRAGATLAPIAVRAKAETDQNSLRATTTTIGRGNQDLNDVPQSVTIMTEKLLDDRRADTVNQALHYAGGITFQAAEGGEEDIRLRGFSLTASGDIYADSVRDPAFYDRDVFNFDRIELLRGSASMLFGRGSTGGVVNQVSKQPVLANVSEVQTIAGTGQYFRATGDFNLQTSASSAVRLNAMGSYAENYGNTIDKYGIAPTFRWGIGTADEFALSYYYLNNDNGINYGMPWLRQASSGPTSATNPASLVKVDPRNYYGAASDYSAGYASYGTAQYNHRFADRGELHTILRHGRYDRDQRASTIRFCTRGANNANPGCPVDAPSQETVSGASPLTLGTNNKVQDLTATYLQTDYTNTVNWFGRPNQLIAGVDLAREEFNNYTLSLPPGVVLNKNDPRSYLGAPDSGPWVDEALRIQTLNRNFVAKALGIYAQDLIEVVPNWKILAGARWDKFSGDYTSPATPTVGELKRARSDSLWSGRGGVLYQPSDALTFYASYGTSFNTSGELYNYDAEGSNTPPEKSSNLEAGVKSDLLAGNLSVRAAIFKTTKYNERNRDSPNGVPLDDYLLSGKRHASGVDLDLAGRITPQWEAYLSYEWIPIATIDKVQGVTLTGELEGQRPSMTPRHSGSLFTTYQTNPDLRLGAGLNARSSQTPNRNPPGIVAPGFVTYDLFAEYAFTPQILAKITFLNITNKLYADSLYTAHYIPGQPRTLFASLTARF